MMTERTETSDSPEAGATATIVDRIRDEILQPAAFPPDLARAARRRFDRVAAGDGVRARGARQAGPAGERGRRARSTTSSSRAWTGSRSRPGRRTDRGRGHRDGVQRPDPHRRGRARRPLHHQHRPPRRQPDVRRGQLVRRVGGGLRRDGVRRHQGAGRAAQRGDRHPHLPGDPDRHGLVPPLEHHAAHVRHLPADRRGGREPGDHGAARLRQQQLRQAEADWRAARPDGARRRRPAGRPAHGRRDARRRAAARTTTPKGSSTCRSPRARSRRSCSSRRPAPTARSASACGRSTTSTCAWSRASSAAAATRTPPASPSPGRLEDVQPRIVERLVRAVDEGLETRPTE